jgi:rhodanese-related sulfurtransferase
MPGPNHITPAQLSRLIGTPEAPILLDVRNDSDFADDPRLIPTARRIPHDQVTNHLSELVQKPCVVICHKGKKLSEGAAARLRSNGISAESLDGGFLAWANANLPLTPAAILKGTECWVTRHRPKIDRIACPWLIRRFVNPKAEFLFVSPTEVAGVAQHFNALPFDCEDVFWTHREDKCSFETMLTEFGLETEALLRLALVVRAADTNRHDLAPEAAGLLALSVGLSRLYKDDLAQLDAGMALYDALYRWARDGHSEGHDWPAQKP